MSLPSSSLLSTEHLNPTKVSLQLSCEAKAFISGLLFDFNSSFTFTSKPGLPLVAWCVNCSNDCFIESPQDSRQEEKEDQSQPVVEMASGTDLLLHRLLPLLTDILYLTALLCFNLCGCLCALHPKASHFLQRFLFLIRCIFKACRMHLLLFEVGLLVTRMPSWMQLFQIAISCFEILFMVCLQWGDL